MPSCLFLLAFLLLTSGCSDHGRMTFTPLDQAKPQKFTQDFPKAYCSRTTDGDWDFLLMDDGLPDAASIDDHGQPLQPVARPAFQQLLHIRVLWRPLRGAKPDFPAATNAGIDWYVMEHHPDGKVDMLHYSGVAFVSVYPNGHGASIMIGNAQIALLSRHGTLQDPIARAALTGNIDTTYDEQRIQQTLTDLRAIESAASPHPAPTTLPATDIPPARRPAP